MSGEEFRRALDLREALRALAMENAGAPPGRKALAGVGREAERSRLAVRFGRGGTLEFGSVAADGFDRAIGQILARVAESMAYGNWQRLKARARDVCLWVFYDRSPNGSATWCAMSICGSREKARTYYRRRRSVLGSTHARSKEPG